MHSSHCKLLPVSRFCRLQAFGLKSHLPGDCLSNQGRGITVGTAHIIKNPAWQSRNGVRGPEGGRLVVGRGFPNSYTGCPLVESAIGDIPAGLASFVIVHCNGPMSSFGDDDENSAEHRLKGRQSSN